MMLLCLCIDVTNMCRHLYRGKPNYKILFGHELKALIAAVTKPLMPEITLRLTVGTRVDVWVDKKGLLGQFIRTNILWKIHPIKLIIWVTTPL